MHKSRKRLSPRAPKGHNFGYTGPFLLIKVSKIWFFRVFNPMESKKNPFGTKKISLFFAPSPLGPDQKSEPNVMDFFLDFGGPKKKSVRFGSPRYRNDPNGIGNIIGWGFGAI